MKTVIQRTKQCQVTVKGEEIGSIKEGLLIFLGIGEKDTKKDADFLVKKIPHLRIFEDENQKMNLSVLDLNKEILIVPQFTLYGDCTQGRRPNFMKAASPDKAEKLYKYFVKKISEYNLKIATGKFKSLMKVNLINDGPVTLLLDSENI